MDFKASTPIYLQIADYVSERILLKEWPIDERIPSVRELAVTLEVNPNTVMRTFDFLQQQEIIYNQRGIGYHVSGNAIKNVLAYRKQQFIENEMPQIFRNMYLLDIQADDLKTRFEKYVKQNFTKA
jgi:GntR family transcriptional regulator